MLNPTTTATAHVGPTAEELVIRARRRELRVLIAKEAAERRAIKDAYKQVHGSDAHRAAMAAVRALIGIDPKHVFEYNWHCQPGRDYGRDYITTLYVELAHLRGKVHLTPKKTPA